MQNGLHREVQRRAPQRLQESSEDRRQGCAQEGLQQGLPTQEGEELYLSWAQDGLYARDKVQLLQSSNFEMLVKDILVNICITNTSYYIASKCYF